MHLIKYITLGALMGVSSLQAASFVQDEDFSHTESFATPGQHLVMPNNFLSTTFQPFDAGLGTLESFTIAWTLNVEWDYVIGDGGNHSVSGGVNAFINSINYNGTGGGSGHSFPGSGTLEFNANTSSTYTVSEISGGTEASLLAIIIGLDPFTSTYASSIDASLIGDASVDVRVNGNVTLTYTYAAVPEPSAFTLFAGLAALMYVAGGRRRAMRARPQ